VKMTPLWRQVCKRRVLEASRALIARGVIPSEKTLFEAIPDLGSANARMLRDELQQEGLIDWSHLGRDYGAGLAAGDVPTRRELIEIHVRYLRERRLKEEAIASGKGRDKCPPRTDREAILVKRIHCDPRPPDQWEE
jgi:hypothetical protein